MIQDSDQTQALVAKVRDAIAAGTPLVIAGGGSKAFYGHPVSGDTLSVAGHRGIVNYDPSELVLTARAGTPLTDIEALLAQAGQSLPFEPPNPNGRATLGGAFATGLSGPRRPWAGSARDLVLGVRLLDGHGEHCRYGGEVMKNVAGYDVSRLVTGALGTLGVITEVSLKVLPAPAAQTTRVLDIPAESGMRAVDAWYRTGHPVTGACRVDGRLMLRLAGSASAVDVAVADIGGEPLADAENWWRSLADQALPFFQAADDTPLWRIALPPLAPALGLEGASVEDWNGQLRWLRSRMEPGRLRERVRRLGGHATLYQQGLWAGDPSVPVFEPLDPVSLRLNRNLRQAFDPRGLFNPGRMASGH